jgi:hypothetical protein
MPSGRAVPGEHIRRGQSLHVERMYTFITSDCADDELLVYDPAARLNLALVPDQPWIKRYHKA